MEMGTSWTEKFAELVDRHWIAFNLLLVLIPTVVTLIPQLPYLTPTGADGGHYLFFGRTFPNVVGYAPMVPFLIAFFAGVASASNYLLMKLFSSILYALLAWSAFRLVRESTPDLIVALVGYVVVLFSGTQWESLAWGAYPQILALVFGFIALTFTIRYSRQPRTLDAALTGLFLGLAVLTHVTTAFFGGAACLAFVAVSGARERLRWLAWIVVLALPGTIVSYAIVGSSGFTSLRPLAFATNINTDYFVFVYSFGGLAPYDVVALLAALLLFSIGVFMLFLRNERRSATIKLFLALLVAAVLTSLVVPVQFASRLSYFVFFPFVIFMAYCAVAIGWKGIRPIAVIGLILLYMGGGFLHYVNSLQYYGTITGDQLQAFDWIKNNTAPNDGVVVYEPNVNTVAWWMQGVTLRTPFIYGDTRWLLLQQERTRTETAILSLNGRYVVEGGPLSLADGDPYWGRSSPAVFLNNGLDFFEVFGFDDAQFEFSFSPAGSPGVVYNESLYYASSKSPISWQVEDGQATSVVDYSWAGVSAQRTTIVAQDMPIEVTYNVSFTNATASQFQIGFSSPDRTSITSLASQANALSFRVVRDTQESVGAVLDYSVDSASLAAAPRVEPNQWGIPSIELFFNPAQGSNAFSFTFKLAIDGYQFGAPTLVDASYLMSSSGVRWVLLSSVYANYVDALNMDPRFQLEATFGQNLIYEFVGANQTAANG